MTGERHHGWETQPAMSRQGVGTHQGSTSPSLPQGWTQESPGVPGLDSGMTLGKWRREGLRGLWRERHRGEAAAGRSPGPQATAGAKGRSHSTACSRPPSASQVPGKVPGSGPHQPGCGRRPVGTPDRARENWVRSDSGSLSRASRTEPPSAPQGQMSLVGPEAWVPAPLMAFLFLQHSGPPA